MKLQKKAVKKIRQIAEVIPSTIPRHVIRYGPEGILDYDYDFTYFMAQFVQWWPIEMRRQ